LVSSTKLPRLIATVLIASSTSTCLAAAADEKTSCRTFVQSFYDWYVGKCKAPVAKKSSPLEIALTTRSQVFSPDLCKRLKEDVAASAKSSGEIVGLDFDPILNTQSQVDRCKAERIIHKGNSFLVDVYALSGGKRDAEPDVQPELIQSNGKWQFVNFHYNVDNKNDDLRHILETLRDERKPRDK
jgi:hypothetical protein